MLKKWLIVLILTIVIFISGCENNEKDTTKKENLLNINYNIEGNETSLEKYDTKNPVVALYIENYGSIVMELYPDKAKNTVNNFISLVKSGFYDKNTIHRLAPNFVLQGGDPTGTGTGGPGYTIKGEFKKNGIENDLKHEKGVVSMARNGMSYDSAGSQFFIMLETSSYLDDDYAAFGKVIDGWKNIENIVETEKVSDEETGKLTENLTIKKALMDLKGKEYEEPEKINEH